MDAQPDLEKLSGALTTASHEIGLFRNVPNFNDGQRLFQAIERLSTSINNLGTQVGTLRTEVVTLRTEMNAKFDTLELRMSADSLNHTARIYNSHISNRNTPLRMILDQRKMMVEGFPRDPAHLMQLTGIALTTLLNAYQLPTDGNLESKKRRFREFVGLVVDA